MAKKSDEFVVRAYVRARLLSEKQFKRVWAHFGSPPFLASKYDNVERTKNEYSSKQWADGYKLYSYLAVLIRGPLALATVESPQSDASVEIWTIWIKPKAIASAKDRGKWLNWLTTLFSLADVLFASGCTDDEFREKHEEAGWRPPDFERQLPGIYWLTYFGAPLAGKLRKLLDTVKQIELHENDAGGVLAILKEPPLPADVAKRVELEQSIAAQLGSEFFFDKDTPHARKKQFPELVAALRKKT